MNERINKNRISLIFTGLAINKGVQYSFLALNSVSYVLFVISFALFLFKVKCNNTEV